MKESFILGRIIDQGFNNTTDICCHKLKWCIIIYITDDISAIGHIFGCDEMKI